MTAFYKRIRALVLILFLLVLSGFLVPANAVVQLMRQNATDKIPFLLVDSSTGQIGQTGQAGNVVIKVSKNGGAGAASAGTVAEVDATNHPGLYMYTPTATETNTVGILAFNATCTGCVTRTFTVQIQPPTTTLANGQAQAGGASTITLAASTSATDNLYKGEMVVLTDNTGAGQARTITGYVGATHVATVSWPWTTQPDTTTLYILIATSHPVTDSNLAVAAGAVNSGAVAPSGFFANLGTVTANATQLGGQAVTATGGITFSPGTVSTLTQSQVTGGTYALNTDNGGNVKISSGTGANQLNISGGNLAGSVASVVGNVGGNLTGTIGGYASGQDPATLVLDVAASGHNVANSIGAKINAAGAAGNPLATLLSGGGFTVNDGSFGGLLLNMTFDASHFIKSNVQVLPAAPANFLNSAAFAAGTVAPAGFINTAAFATGTIAPSTFLNSTTAPSGWLNTNDASDIAQISNSVWSTINLNGFAAGSAGKAMFAAGQYTDPWQTLLSNEITANSFGTLVKQALPNAAPGASGGLDIVGTAVTLPATAPANFLNSTSFAAGTQAPAGFLTNEYQAIANTLLGSVLDGSITVKQAKVIDLALQTEVSRTWNSATHTATDIWYRRLAGGTGADTTKPVVTKTTVYDATNTQVVSSTITFTNLP